MRLTYSKIDTTTYLVLHVTSSMSATCHGQHRRVFDLPRHLEGDVVSQNSQNHVSACLSHWSSTDVITIYLVDLESTRYLIILFISSNC